MIPRRSTRLIFFGLLVVAIIFMLYMIATPDNGPRHLQPEPLSDFVKHRKSHFEYEEMMTQSPGHLRKQKEYESMLLANIQKMTVHKQLKRKMDHDPMGIIIHKEPGLLDGLGRVRDMEGQDTALRKNVVMDNQLKHKIVHIDLKGAPPKVEYLKTLFPLLSSLGATGLLIEYEDMFPYWGKLEPLSAHNAYAKGDIADILEVARKNNLEVIPLVQTIGHMEHVLKLKEFAELREVPHYPQVICPTNNKTIPLIKAMIDQMLELHPGINWLHIGSDEVYNLGECTRCQQYLLHQRFGKSDLFLHHIKKVAQYVKDTYDIQPIMWDDEFRKVPLKAIQAANFGNLVEVMVWKYNRGIMVDLRTDIWEKYSIAFNGIWIASAFKGASAPESYITDVNERLSNHKEWMEIVDMYKGTIPFRGIVLTGWQRFDHFAVLCELLPQGIPSLAVNLMYITERKADHGALAKIGNLLKCNSFLNLDLKYLEYANKCNFPGSDVYEISQKLYILKKDIDNMMRNPHVTGWVTDYNIEHSFASPQHVEQGLQDLSMLLFDFNKLISDAEKALNKVFDEYTVKEWTDFNLKPTFDKLQKLHNSCTKLLEIMIWPRKPFDSKLLKEL
ncbi:Hydrolase activity protein [Halocaridina rubra]|uniref:beta-N-acetylhexosaminidase n=1 Tax=Halocaridina rubra TaxID=373956 RepID=A0AAN9A6L2_HALRR